LVVKYV